MHINWKWAVVVFWVVFFTVPWTARCCGVQDAVLTPFTCSSDLSMFDATIGNLKAIRKCDFLVRVKETFDSVNGADGFDRNGALVQRYGLFRVAIDLDNDFFCCYQIQHQSTLDLFASQEEGPQSATQKLYKAICLNGVGPDALVRSAVFPGGMQSTPWANSQRRNSDPAKTLGIPNFLGAGVLDAMPASLETLESTIARLKGNWNVESVLDKSDGVVEIRYAYSEKRILLAKTTRFDTFSSMPVGFSSEVYFSENPEFTTPKVGEWSKIDSGTVTWNQIKQIYVVERLTSEKNIRESVNGKEHLGELFTEYDIHWFSVNEDLSPDLFNGEFLSSLDSMMKVVDPAICGADQLIDRNPALKKTLQTDDGNPQ